MVLCRFYQQGNCRFGDQCKFEHQINRGDQNYGGTTSILLQNYGNTPQQSQPQPGGPIDTNTLVKSVVADMTSAEKGGQWLLSSFSPFKDKAPFPGFEDYCMEEIRLMYYEAMKNGTVEQYKHNLQMMLQQAIIKIKSLQNPSPEAIEILKQIYDSGNIPQNVNSSIFGGSQPPASPPYGVATPQQSIFGGTNSVFGSQPQVSSSTTPFAGNFPQTVSNSIFGGTPQNSSVFSSTNQQNSSIFSANPQQQNSIFATTPQQPAAFQPQSVFGGAQQSVFGGNQVFAATSPPPSTPQPQSIYGGGNVSQQQQVFGGTQQQNVIGTNQSVFGGTQQQTGAVVGQQSVFGGTQPQSVIGTNQSVFGGAQQQNGAVVGQQSVFAGVQPQSVNGANPVQQSAFGGVAQQNSSIFGGQSQNQPQQGPFTAQQINIFQQNSKGGFESGNPGNNQQAYQHSNNIFGNATSQVGSDFNPGMALNTEFYSKMDELSELDIKWFQSDDLDIENIPERPPAYEMCFRS